MTYTSLDMIEKRVGRSLSSDEQLLVSSLIDRVKNIIDTFCGRSFEQRTEKHIFDGSPDIEYWYAPYRPLVSVTSIVCDGETLIEGEDYWVYPGSEGNFVRFEKGVLTAKNYRNVTVTYVCGYSTIPRGIEHAATEMVVQAFNNYLADYTLEGASSASIADLSFSFQKEELLTPEIENLLSEFRQVYYSAIG